MTNETPITAQSSIGQWLDHPAGGPLIRSLLEQSGTDPAMLAPMRSLPLQQLVAASGGQMPQSVVDDLVLAANGGVAPEPATRPAALPRVHPAGAPARDAPAARCVADAD